MASPRRLLAVAAVSHPGGAETTLLRLLRELRTGGWQITLTTPAPGPLADAGRELGVRVESLAVGPLRPRPWPAPAALAAWPRARRLAAEHDVAYLNGTVCGRLLPALTGRSDVRRVLHVHDIVERVPRLWRRADVVLAASGAVARALQPLSAEVVYAPVDAHPPDTPAPWPPGPGPVVGFVGRIEPRKGPLDLVLAAPMIRRAVPDARVVVVGEDPYRSDPQYVDRVRQGAVEHYGWIPDADGLMRHLDVLVLPSRREPFGTVLAEAMAVGTPVVAAAVDGLPEVVQDGVSGALVAPGDPPALAAAVIRVLADRDRLSEGARRAAERFHAPAYARRVEALIAP